MAGILLGPGRRTSPSPIGIPNDPIPGLRPDGAGAAVRGEEGGGDRPAPPVERAGLPVWQNSRWVLSGGQSGTPLSLHYRDLFEVWRRGDGVPIAFTAAEVEAAGVA